jgi:hypothetical protein
MDDNYQTLLDFVTLLRQARTTPNPELFGKNQEYLKELRESLATVEDDEYEIARLILAWQKKYPQIQTVFNQTNWVQVRCDMFEPGEEPPEKDPKADRDRVLNLSLIQSEIDNTLNPPPSPGKK